MTFAVLQNSSMLQQPPNVSFLTIPAIPFLTVKLLLSPTLMSNISINHAIDLSVYTVYNAIAKLLPVKNKLV